MNRDGRANFYDAAIVDGFSGQSYKNLDQQLAAVVALNQNDGGTVFVGTGNTTDPIADQVTSRRQISLVDVELNDDANINAADVTVANTALSGAGTDIWASGVSQKIGPTTIAFNRTSSSVTVPAGASLRIAGGTVENSGVDVFTQGNNSLDVITTSTGTFKVSGGSSKVNSVIGTGNVVATGGTLTAKLGIVENSLAISTGATVAVGTTVKVSTLSISGTPAAPDSKLDLGSGYLVIDYANGNLGAQLSDNTARVKTGRGTANGGGVFTYAGLGITSSVAAAQNAIVGFNKFAIGIVNNGDLPLASQFSTFGGVGVDASSVIARYTYNGDANLDGAITAADYSLINTAFANGTLNGGWVTGDFTLDGVVNADDYAILDFAALSWGGVVLGAGEVVAVPEPGSVAFLGVVAAAALTRRRRA